ncbi:MAG: thiamine diphosphokinase [Bacteroidales bacterium]|nr:thiamine diphosphokinase [Bacteroidales bacterium]
MSTAVIIGGGDFPKKTYPRELIRRADVIVCCDGNALKAFLRCRKAIFVDESRLPDAVVGDMDSMTPRLINEYSRLLVRVEEQDDNDQTKALRFVLGNYPEVDTIHFIAATGKREDHTIGNLGLLMEYARTLSKCHPETCPELAEGRSEGSLSIDMVSDHSTAFAVTDSCDLYLGTGRRISLFSPDNSLRITSNGLKWQTSGVVFDNWWPATLNKTTEDVVHLDLSHKSLVLIITD